MKRSLGCLSAVILVLGIGCRAGTTWGPEGAGGRGVQPLWTAEKAPPASPRVSGVAGKKKLATSVKNFFAGNQGRRIYIQVDKPIYKPGDTIWVKTWDLRTRDLKGKHKNKGIRYMLMDPRGSVVFRKLVKERGGMASNDFVLPDGIRGGEYKVKVVTMDSRTAERPVLISTYEPPRIKKKLEFLRKAYGPGDEVTATIEVKRPTGEPLKNHPLKGVPQVDGRPLPSVRLKTDSKGAGVVRFKLPKVIQVGDGLLTVMVEDGGITESVTKRIPILLKKVRIAFFPEGGDLKKPADLEGKVVDDRGTVVSRFRSYFHGLGRFGIKPQSGRTYHVEITKPVGVKDRYALPQVQDEGCVVNSYDDFDSRRSAIVVRVRCTTAQRVIVSAVLRENLLDAAAVDVPEDRPAVVYLKNADGKLNRAQGAARVTVFSRELIPLAERLVYRNRRNRLKVRIKTNRKTYTPRGKITVHAKTTDSRGNPVPAELALSVVDDTVVSYADDKTGHMLSRLYMEPEIPFKVHEPKKYFDPKNKKAAKALDLLMGTAGYRRFAWRVIVGYRPKPRPRPQPIARWRKWRKTRRSGRRRMYYRTPPQVRVYAEREVRKKAEERPFARVVPRDRLPVKGRPVRGARPIKVARRMEVGKLKRRVPPAKHVRPMPGAAAQRPLAMGPVPAPPPKPMARPAEPAADDAAEAPMRRRRVFAAGVVARKLASPSYYRSRRRWVRKWGRARRRSVRLGYSRKGLKRKWQWLRGRDARRRALRRARRRPFRPSWAKVRVFPRPKYKSDFKGKRTDFRETVYWAPRVRTGDDGEASVSFYLSDAVTSFRIFAEGVGRGLAGRTEKVFKSSLPFSMHVKLPVEVSARDRMNLPLILTNETSKPLEVTVDSSFGKLLRAEGSAKQRKVYLRAGQRKSLFYRVAVTGVRGKSKVSFAARAGGLKDEFIREVTVVPLGFPMDISYSGEVLGTAKHRFDLSDAVPGTVTAAVRLYPSPVSTMMGGLEGMMRHPTGCFEQASSANYPNVMVMAYAKEHRVKNAKLLERSAKMLDAGYRKLTGYESKTRGYEWFGHDPGHEALTAYGLLQFMDMKQVYKGVSLPMIKRTAAWLKKRRDGSGGYKRNPKGLDSFGRATKAVTDAYITYSLTEAGQSGLGKEISKQAELASTTKDAYLLALAANTLLNTKSRRGAGMAAAAKLVAMQGKGGAWTKAAQSVTRSGGKSLTVETTSLAAMALLKTGRHRNAVRRAVGYLQKARGGYGQWGSTQATVLALRAMSAYAKASRKTRYPGSLRIQINTRTAALKDYASGEEGPLVFKDLHPHLIRGKNMLELVHVSKEPLPYSIAVSYRVQVPPSSPKSVVGLSTRLNKKTAKMGETVRMTVTVKNRTQQGQPMTLAWIGFPGGLNFQNWQLKELREKGLIAFYETRAREVILYFRHLRPGETKTINLDLVAVLPGKYIGPASRAFLYYTNEYKTWVQPETIVVKP
jgi:hypothetical protein